MTLEVNSGRLDQSVLLNFERKPESKFKSNNVYHRPRQNDMCTLKVQT